MAGAKDQELIAGAKDQELMAGTKDQELMTFERALLGKVIRFCNVDLAARAGSIA
jgi:hypothetical protein